MGTALVLFRPPPTTALVRTPPPVAPADQEDTARLAELAAEIKREHEASEYSVRESLAHARAAGVMLLEVKELLPHGKFMAWIKTHCGFSQRTANLYMKVARRWNSLGNWHQVANLTLRDAGELLSVDPSEQHADAIGDLVNLGLLDWHHFEGLGVLEVRELVKEVRSIYEDLCSDVDDDVKAARAAIPEGWCPSVTLSRGAIRTLAVRAAKALQEGCLKRRHIRSRVRPQWLEDIPMNDTERAHRTAEMKPAHAVGHIALATDVHERRSRKVLTPPISGTKTSLRVLSCVPAQKYRFTDKLEWAEQQIKAHKPEMLVLPQEYHGGVQSLLFKEQGTTEKVAYDPKEITDPYTELAKSYKVGIAVGALVDDPALGERRERIWIIDPDEGVTGHADKMFLPGYDHVGAKGSLGVWPEPDFKNREQAFYCCGARVGILFCWESFSSDLWYHIARAQPDFVVSLVKFGVKGWPAKKNGGEFTGFGFGDDGGWIERLQIAAKWDLAAPIVVSTNSWNLPKKVGAIAGQILPFDEHEIIEGVNGAKQSRAERTSSLWVSEGKGNLDRDHVQVDDVDFMYWRYIRDDKHRLKEVTGDWPSSEARHLTMSWKVRRMARKFAGLPKIAAEVERVPVPPRALSEEGLLAVLGGEN